MLKKYGNSSFLTPESATYLNEAIKLNKSAKLDDEIVYAGLHQEKLGKIKFKRNEKNK